MGRIHPQICGVGNMNMAQHWPHIIASIMSGFTCCVTGWWYLSIAGMPRLDRLRSSMEIRRRDALRSGSTLYRDLEPVVDDLSTWFARPRSTPHPDLSRLGASPLGLPTRVRATNLNSPLGLPTRVRATNLNLATPHATEWPRPSQRVAVRLT
jgi:hypothetical protein